MYVSVIFFNSTTKRDGKGRKNGGKGREEKKSSGSSLFSEWIFSRNTAGTPVQNFGGILRDDPRQPETSGTVGSNLHDQPDHFRITWISRSLCVAATIRTRFFLSFSFNLFFFFNSYFHFGNDLIPHSARILPRCFHLGNLIRATRGYSRSIVILDPFVQGSSRAQVCIVVINPLSLMEPWQ